LFVIEATLRLAWGFNISALDAFYCVFGGTMSNLALSEHELLWKLKKTLPFEARGRTELIAFLKRRLMQLRAAPTLKITNIYMSENGSLLCQFHVAGTNAAATFVAPLEQFALAAGHPATRELAQYRQRSSRRGRQLRQAAAGGRR
jgi:hypothetical protein